MTPIPCALGLPEGCRKLSEACAPCRGRIIADAVKRGKLEIIWSKLSPRERQEIKESKTKVRDAAAGFYGSRKERRAQRRAARRRRGE